MDDPKISVCLPTYHYAQYLPQAIDSVLCQTFTDFELLITDDCSTDSSDEILQAYARRDSRIRYIRHQKNLGMVENWNYCLRQAKGQYIKFLFGDDYFVSDQTLKKMLSVMEADASISLVSSARTIVDEQSVKTAVWGYDNKDLVVGGFSAIQHCLLRHDNLIGEPTAVMFRAAQSRRGFNRHYRQIVDLEMWFHLLEQGRYAFLAEPLCAFRLHHRQQTANISKDILLHERVQIGKDFLHHKELKFRLIDRIFLPYDAVYQIWKQCCGRKAMKKEIAQTCIMDYGVLKFYLLLPLYKTYKPLRKLHQYLTLER